MGFDLRAGYPLTTYTYGFVTYKNEGLQIVSQDPTVALDRVLADSGVLSSVVWSVVRDRRNNRYETSNGSYQSVSVETAGLGGDKAFVKTVMNNRFYRPLLGDLVFRTSQELGHVTATSSRELAPSERFYLGGPNNLKGFALFGLGPSTVGSYGRLQPWGGEFQALSLFELEYPLIREAGLKFVTFFDVGNCWAKIPAADGLSIRSDAGFGFRWFSPIGPLRFEWGYPFARKPGEDSSVFQFFIGPPF